jgi:hypothetical protein
MDTNRLLKTRTTFDGTCFPFLFLCFSSSGVPDQPRLVSFKLLLRLIASRPSLHLNRLLDQISCWPPKQEESSAFSQTPPGTAQPGLSNLRPRVGPQESNQHFQSLCLAPASHTTPVNRSISSCGNPHPKPFGKSYFLPKTKSVHVVSYLPRPKP